MQPRGWLSYFTVLFLLVAWTASAQRASNWRVYKAADGLPETLTTAVSVGPHGRVWVRQPNIDSIGGLDGYDIRTIRSPGSGNSRIYESPSGQLWTYTAEGLQSFQDGDRGWVHYELPDITATMTKTNLGLFWPVELCPLKQNEVLILVPEKLVEFSLDENKHSRTTLLRAAQRGGLGKFSGLCVSRDGGLWLSAEHGLGKLTAPIRNLTPDTPWQEYPVPATLRIRNFSHPVEDADGGITVVGESFNKSETIVAHFNKQQWTIEATLHEKIVMGWRGVDDSFWVTTFRSLFQFHDGQSSPGSTEQMPRRNFDVAVETNGVFWLASSDGLLRHAPLTWQAPANIQLSNAFIQAITEDQSGRLWVYSANSLHLFQNEAWTNYTLPPDGTESSPEYRPIYILPDETSVIQSGPGLFQFDPISGTFKPLTDHDQSRIKALGFLKNGNLCVQGEDTKGHPAQLKVFDGTNFTAFPYPLPDSFGQADFEFLISSPNGDLWLSGERGIARYHEKKWQNITTPKSSPSDALSCLLEVSDGKVWCGVQDKIVEFNGQTWSTVRAGFYHVNSLLKARDGSIWVAADNGLHRFYRGIWLANEMEEGLPSAAVQQIYEDTHGRIWAATDRGLSLYHPEADPDPPRTYVQNLPGANNSVHEGAAITINFSAEDRWKYTSPDRLLFSYRLDGQEWSPYQEQRNVTFLGLPAGKHSFHVRSMDRNWNVDRTPALLEFTVTVPWYREARLLLISFLGLGFAVFFAALAFNRHRRLVRSYAEVEAQVALRTQQLELANRELFHSQKMNALGTLAAGIAHDFNNILSIIKGSAQIIDDNLDNTEKIRTRTDRIKMVVEQGAGIVKAMLGFSRVSDRELILCDVNSVVRETITLLGDRFLREIEVQFATASAVLPPVPASKDFIQQILLNFIFNAADAMTDRRQLILSTIQSHQLPPLLALKPATATSYVFISVKDFGSGIEPKVMPRIFEPFFTTKALSARRGTGLGLSMVYELARQMDCGLHVESEPGKGSIFTLIIPVRNLPVELTTKTS